MSRSAYEEETLPGGKRRVRATVGYVGRKQVRRQKTFPKNTLVREIKAWVVKQKADFEAGNTTLPSRLTVGELAEQWMRLKKAGLKEQTKKRYREMLAKPLLRTFGRTPVQRVRTADLDAMLDGMVTRGLSARTVQYYFEVYRQLFEYAVSRGLFAKNPVKGIVLPALEKRRRVEVLELEEVRRFLELASQSRFYALYLLLVTTGLRIGEALALEWRDLDLGEGRLTVNKSLDDLYADRRSSPPKSQHAYRTVPMPKQLVDVLAARKRSGVRVFEPSAHPYKSVAAELKRSLEAIGARPLSLHGLRHTACSLMLRQGVSIKVVQYVMGHHSAAFTLDTYAHLLRGEADSVGPAIEAAIGSRSDRVAVSTTVQTHAK